MFRKIVIIAASFAALIAPLAASAGEVGNRVHDQQARIAQGVRSGQLTYGEYRRDESHLQAINAQRDRDLRHDGGHLTAGQQAQLNRELNRNSGRIYFTKHNLAHQPGA
ncbi:MAG TPA: hypothetical protein VME66_06075 [Candidatus Acidoferrales bacterium]|nr:hypothetical protein [Candidatus Acidoferrales bacterium]